MGWSEFLDLNHTTQALILVSLMIPKFAPEPSPRALANFGIGTLAPDGVLEVPLVNTISLA